MTVLTEQIRLGNLLGPNTEIDRTHLDRLIKSIGLDLVNRLTNQIGSYGLTRLLT